MGCKASSTRANESRADAPKHETTAPAAPVRAAPQVVVATPHEEKPCAAAEQRIGETVPTATVQECEAPATAQPSAPTTQPPSPGRAEQQQGVAQAEVEVAEVVKSPAPKKSAKKVAGKKPQRGKKHVTPLAASKSAAAATPMKAAAPVDAPVARKTVTVVEPPRDNGAKSAKDKAKARALRTALQTKGARGGHVNVELFMQQCAAFERLLTHASTFATQMDSR